MRTNDKFIDKISEVSNNRTIYAFHFIFIHMYLAVGSSTITNIGGKCFCFCFQLGQNQSFRIFEREKK